MNRSPNATKDEMQIAIDLLRARGDSCMEIIETTTLKVENLLSELNTLRAKLREVDDQLGIQPQHRRKTQSSWHADYSVMQRRISLMKKY